ncbi:hypothetical protein ACSU1N_06925 [Thermogladius sp. 4427co]|uniref:hypothetical protein n=1 Tax=Thermogladius sp. 4427co TaxID=3450718 RepID=UPI003F78D761
MSLEKSSSTGMSDKKLVLTSFTERGYSKLYRFIRAARGVVALPIPRTLCESVLSSRGLDSFSNTSIPASLRRVWWSLLRKVDASIADRIICYRSEADYEGLRDWFSEVSVLMIKADVYGRIDEEEWLKVFKTSATPVTLVGDYTVVDNYVEAYMTLRHKPVAYIVVDALIPTPLDLLALISLGELPRTLLRQVVGYALKYFHEYLLRSINLTQAYRRLANDSGYVSFLRANSIRIFLQE